jgi:hypothetical protein
VAGEERDHVYPFKIEAQYSFLSVNNKKRRIQNKPTPKLRNRMKGKIIVFGLFFFLYTYIKASSIVLSSKQYATTQNLL